MIARQGRELTPISLGEPILLKIRMAKHQRRMEGLDDKVPEMYARGMPVRDIFSSAC
jgi:hypothetical protein